MPAMALALLASGGLSYTAGGIIYGLKKPNLSPIFGFHELFHVFVLLGSLMHYLLVLIYVL
jgi:hemolysin III